MQTKIKWPIGYNGYITPYSAKVQYGFTLAKMATWAKKQYLRHIKIDNDMANIRYYIDDLDSITKKENNKKRKAFYGK